MHTADQINFIKQHCDTLRDKMLMTAQKSKLPESWEGLELKQYIADSFSIPHSFWSSRIRKKQYNNDILINNL